LEYEKEKKQLEEERKELLIKEQKETQLQKEQEKLKELEEQSEQEKNAALAKAKKMADLKELKKKEELGKMKEVLNAKEREIAAQKYRQELDMMKAEKERAIRDSIRVAYKEADKTHAKNKLAFDTLADKKFQENKLLQDEYTRLKIDKEQKLVQRKKDLEQQKANTVKKQVVKEVSSEEAKNALAAKLKYEAELRNNKKLAARTLQLKEEARHKDVAEQQKMKMFEKEKMLIAKQKAREDSLRLVKMAIDEKQRPIQEQISEKSKKRTSLEEDVVRLKEKEMLILQSYVRENSVAKEMNFNASKMVGIEKIKKSAEVILQQKKSLETKLQAKENYLVRLGKQEELNKIRQELNILQFQLDNMNSKVDTASLNGVLSVQQQNIIQSMEKIKAEITVLEGDVKSKEEEYNNELQLAKQEEDKQKKSNALKKKTNGSMKDLNQQLEAYRKNLKEAVTSQEKEKIKKQIVELEQSYPEGIYEELITETNRTIKRVVVSKAANVTIYKMIVYGWGGAFYFKNDVNITKQVFDKETTY